MTTHFHAMHSTSDGSAPVVALPEDMHGFVDLKILTDIHRNLVESEMEEDTILAKWVQENFLLDSTCSVAGTIGTTEGFSQLDRAYRRVRSLTNKAQDKWPFFDKNWKEMSSITVRNNARGEIAPGVTCSSLPAPHQAASALPTLDYAGPSSSPAIAQAQQPPPETQQNANLQGFSPPPPTRVSIPRSSTSVEAEKHAGSEARLTTFTFLESHHAEQARQTAKAFESNSLSKILNHTDLEDVFDARNGATVRPEVSHESARGKTDADLEAPPPDLTSMMDNDRFDSNVELMSNPSQSLADGKKTRGPNGRYQSKNEPIPIPRKTRGRSAGVQGRKRARSKDAGENIRTKIPRQEKRRTVADQAADDHVVLDMDDVHSDTQPSSTTDQHELEDITHTKTSPHSERSVFRHVNVHRTNDLCENVQGGLKDGIPDDTTSTASLASPALAVEAESVASNLDRLPPMRVQRPINRVMKRKREPAVDQLERKLGRNGSSFSRFRKSDPSALRSSEDVDENGEEKTTITMADDTHMAGEESVPRMATRRLTRRSVAPILGSPSSETNEGIPEPKEKTSDHVVTAVADIKDVDARADHTKSEIPDDVDHEESVIPKAKKVTKSRILKFSVTPDSKLKARSTKGTRKLVEPVEHIPAQASSKHDDHATSQTPIPGHVEYLARIHLSSSVVDVPLAAETLVPVEHECLKKYAEWMTTEGGTYIPYQQFRSIFGFAKKG